MSTKTDENLAVFLLLAGTVCLLACLGFQVFTFAKYGYWRPVSVVDVMAWVGSAWATYPLSWYGVHKVLAFMNAGLFVFIPSVLLAFVMLAQQ